MALLYVKLDEVVNAVAEDAKGILFAAQASLPHQVIQARILFLIRLITDFTITTVLQMFGAWLEVVLRLQPLAQEQRV